MSTTVDDKSVVMVTTTATKPDDEYTSYKQYLADYAGDADEYRWLRTFFDTPGSTDSETRVTLIDCLDGELQEQGQFTADTEAFSQALSTRPDESRTRLIIVSYSYSWRINKEIVDRLALLFKIEPDFLRKHFYYYFSFIELNREDRKRQAEETIDHTSEELVSQHMGREYHLASTRSYYKLSAYMHQESNTVLLWMRDDAKSADRFTAKLPRNDFSQLPSETRKYSKMSMFYTGKLQDLSHDEIEVCNKEPAMFLYPYIIGLIMLFGKTHQEKYNSAREELLVKRDNHFRGLDDAEANLFQVTFQQGALSALRRETDLVYASLSSERARNQLDKLRSDIDRLSQKFETSAQYFREAKSSALIYAQFDEARASTNAALSVGRLSKLAFVFIPLSFTTSVFGMNVIEFGQGVVPLRTFFITAVIVSTCALIPLWHTFWRAIARSGVIDDTKIIYFLALRSVKLASMYLSLCVQLDHAIVMSLCGRDIHRVLKIRNIIEYEPMRLADAERRMARDYQGLGPRFWKERAEAIRKEVEAFEVSEDPEK